MQMRVVDIEGDGNGVCEYWGTGKWGFRILGEAEKGLWISHLYALNCLINITKQ